MALNFFVEVYILTQPWTWTPLPYPPALTKIARIQVPPYCLKCPFMPRCTFAGEWKWLCYATGQQTGKRLPPLYGEFHMCVRDSPATGVCLLGPSGGPAHDGGSAMRREVLVEHKTVPVAVKSHPKSAFVLLSTSWLWCFCRELTPPWCRGYRRPTRAWGSSSSRP